MYSCDLTNEAREVRFGFCHPEAGRESEAHLLTKTFSLADWFTLDELSLFTSQERLGTISPSSGWKCEVKLLHPVTCYSATVK